MSEVKETPVVPVATMQIQIGDHMLLFKPADDMTAKECALLTQMFLNAVFVQGQAIIDFGTYIAENQLHRHFVVPDKPVAEQA